MFYWMIPLLILVFIQCSDWKSDEFISENLSFAEKQLSLQISSISDPAKHPRSLDKHGDLKIVSMDDWTSGFFPGCLWYIYQYTHEDQWRRLAERYTQNLESQQFNRKTHDVGFMINCSYGNGYRLTGDEAYMAVIIQSARSLISRFNPIVGCIRSWDHSGDIWQCPVIIDNMMNLELLFLATRLSGDSSFYRIAVTHANTTLKNHFRSDHGSYHVVDYDTLTGKVQMKQTHQGYSDESSWARGQAWALYGFTMCYRETGDRAYLNQARRIAEFILSHPNLPQDQVPYWDYDAPDIPNAPRDASAAAIACSALYELGSYAGRKYTDAADRILKNLSSEYRVEQGKRNHFLLNHCVGHMPENYEVDGPLIYADYYFLEANLRRLAMKEQDQKKSEEL